MTGLSAVQTLLIRTDSPKQVAAGIHAPPGALVNDITAPRVAVPSASGLAAGSLSGLASLTLAFGLLLAGASAGLVLVVAAVQRRRSMTTLAVLGADARQRAGFLWTETRALVIAGMTGGIATGALIAAQLIKVLNGIFDPPPPYPLIPWTFAGALLTAVACTAALATDASARWTGRIDARGSAIPRVSATGMVLHQARVPTSGNPVTLDTSTHAGQGLPVVGSGCRSCEGVSFGWLTWRMWFGT